MDAERIVDRYVLDAPIGRGATGVVWRAHDPITGRDVAIKQWSAPDPDARRWRREVAALRALALPGVVELFDHGLVGDRPFLVMELVEGRAFPGEAGGAPWDAVERPFLSLLDALIGVHQAGFVHRDLKPANVLVRDDGASVLLDLGLARSDGNGHTLTTVGAIVGTPVFMAPEALLGERPAPTADLYSLGVLLFTALTGELPHGADEAGLLRRRLISGAPALPSGVDAPIAVRQAVVALLDPNPSARPSAAQVRAALTRAPRFDLPLPPSELDLSQPGLHIRYAPPGGGRTTWARAVTEGRVTTWIQARPEPMILARALLSDLPFDASISTIEERAFARLRAMATRGEVVVIEDVERLDRRSRDLLERCDELTVLALTSVPGAGATPIPRMTADVISTMFDEPEAIVHIPSDAAALLLETTGGWPGYVAAELGRWHRSGRITDGPHGWRIQRSDLDALQIEGAPLQLPLASDLSDPADEALALIQLADGLAPAEIAIALGVAHWHAEALIEELVDVGTVEVVEGRARPVRGSAALTSWDTERRRAAHAAVARALPEGSRRRWRHLGLGGDADGCGVETIVRAKTLVNSGRVSLARAVLGRAWPWVAGEARADVQRAALTQQARVAVLCNDPAQMDEVLATWRLAGHGDHADVARLLQAGIDAFRGNGAAALPLLLEDGKPPSWDGEHAIDDAWALLVAVAGRACHGAARDSAERALDAWIRENPERRASVSAWRGLNAYLSGRFDQAITLLEAALATGALRADAEIGFSISLAAALSEIGEFEQAAELADTAARLAEERRLIRPAARAAAAGRHARLRSGMPMSVDETLVIAARRHLVGTAAANILATEGFIAWRAHERARAASLLLEAATTYDAIGVQHAAAFTGLVAQASRRAAGAHKEEERVRRWRSRLASAPVGLRVQIAALMPAWQSVTDEEVASIQGRPHLDLLSVEEVLSACQPTTPHSSNDTPDQGFDPR